MKNLKLKLWEKFLIVFALLLLSTSAVIYLSDFPIRNLLFSLKDGEGTTQIGQLSAKEGSLKRQVSGEFEFKEINPKVILYNHDVLVTGDDGKATIQFDNGGVAQLGPKTMVRLDFLSDLQLSGINRYGQIKVVTGQVTAQAGKQKLVIASREKVTILRPNTSQVVKAEIPRPIKKSTPSPIPLPSFPAAIPSSSPLPLPSPLITATPSPTIKPLYTAEQARKIKIISPVRGERLVVEKFSKTPEKKVYLSWTMTPSQGKSFVFVKRVDPDGTGEEVFKQMVTAQNGRATTTFTANQPGKYEWEITGVDGKPISTPQNTKSSFTVERTFEGLQPIAPLVGGRIADSNKLSGDLVTDFEITLRWDSYTGINNYTIWFGSSPTATKAILERQTTKPEFTFNKNKIFAGQLYYKVTAQHPNGFIVTTGVQKFIFNFLPPALVIPEDHAQFDPTTLKKEGNKILLTWQKTNFTIGYELEIGLDASFSKLFLRKPLKENYYVIANPKSGTYWWRARSFTKELASPMSSSSSFTVN